MLSSNNHNALIFSFDVRSKDPDGKHWSAQEPFGGRAFFKAESNTSFLLISDVKLEVTYRK